MSSKVKKYKDGKYHATFGEYRLSEVLKGIENTEGVDEHTRILASTMFHQGFELGYSSGVESSRNDFLEQMKQIAAMTPEQLKSYIKLCEGLKDWINLDHEVVED